MCVDICTFKKKLKADERRGSGDRKHLQFPELTKMMPVEYFVTGSEKTLLSFPPLELLPQGPGLQLPPQATPANAP